VYETAEQDILPLGLPGERERTRMQKSRRRAWTSIFVIFALLVLAGGGLWLYNVMNQPPAEPVQVAVPSVESRTESEALQVLYDAKLRPQIKRVEHDTIAKGTAIGTVPAAGSSLDLDSEITLNISDGPSAVKIPATLPGRTEAAARDILRQAGLVGAPSTTMANSPTVPAGLVITTKPAPGQQVAVGSTVEIIVSTGKVVMPELRGMTRAEAETALKALGLPVLINEVENSQVAPGKVTGQSDPLNALIDQGKTITITVAKAPAPAPEPTPTPTSTPKPTSSPSAKPKP
jgi:serine/threonine-protein kinase